MKKNNTTLFADPYHPGSPRVLFFFFTESNGGPQGEHSNVEPKWILSTQLNKNSEFTPFFPDSFWCFEILISRTVSAFR